MSDRLQTTLATLALIASAIAASPAHATGNLLSNPGAETGTLAGWVQGGVSNPGVDDGTFETNLTPHAGLYDFFGNYGSDGTLTQNVVITGIANAQMATVSFWEQGLDQGDPSDNAYISLSFLNASGQSLGDVATPVVDSHALTWTQYTGSFAIPTGTASIDYTMHFVRNQGGDNDSFVDDNSLTISAVPEPASLGLMLAGMAAIGLKLRRRQG